MSGQSVKGRSDPRPVNHGYTHFWHMFNERQLLCLSRLLEEILKIPDINIRELMLTAFSDCLDANNMFCKYEIQWHKISLFFGLHAYHPIERPTENNVWGTKYGRCTFVKCFEKLRRLRYIAKNLMNGYLRAIISVSVSIQATNALKGILSRALTNLLESTTQPCYIVMHLKICPLPQTNR